MKPYEVGIIIAVIALLIYFWYGKAQSTQTANPTNATSRGFRTINMPIPLPQVSHRGGNTGAIGGGCSL